MQIRILVGCVDSNGPALFPVIADVTENHYNNQYHYDDAENIVRENYEVEGPFWVVDEFDNPNNIFSLEFDWDAADQI